MYAFGREAERVHAIASMRPYFETKPEQVGFFEHMVAPYLSGRPGVRVLDACAGMGDLTYYLQRLNPDARFVCSDRAGFLLDAGRPYFGAAAHVTFQVADIHALRTAFGDKAFDLAVCKQTLSWLPDYRDAVRELMAVTRESVFISSLFYDGRIDAEIRVREWTTPAGQAGPTAYYNVYSLPEFRDFCIAHGARDVAGFDFQIGIDLPRPAGLDRMGSFTRQLASGERLLFSGPVYLPWKIVRIDL
jgi:SAM-dependent methyltransferase